MWKKKVIFKILQFWNLFMNFVMRVVKYRRSHEVKGEDSVVNKEMVMQMERKRKERNQMETKNSEK